MDAIAAGLYVLAYLSAVIDGTTQRTGLYPEASNGRVGPWRYAKRHPWIVAGALAGVAATVIALIG